MRLAALLAAALLAAAACAHSPKSPAAPAPDATPTPRTGSSSAPARSPSAPATARPTPAERAERLAAIRAGVEQLLAAQARLLWDAWTQGTAPDFGPSLAAHEALFRPEALALVREQRDAADGDERRALSLLHAFLVGEHLARAAPPAPPRAGGPAAFSWDGEQVPTWRAPALLEGEVDGARRAALERAWVEAARRQGEGEGERWSRIAAAAGAIGYPSLLALAAELRGEPVEALSALAESVLAATDAAYREVLGAVARAEAGQNLAELRARDVPRLLRAGEAARVFPAARAPTDVADTLAALGLALAGRAGVVLDLGTRPGKDPRALAVPVEVPSDVRVSSAPQAGAAALRALLHEMGVAAYYTHVTTKPLEFRRLGAVTAETWGGLFEDLAGDPGWLGERTGLVESHVAFLVRSAVARRLHQARTLAARILVEVARAGAPERAGAAARPILERAFAHGVEPEELELFLLDADPLLEAADELRALLLAAQAQALLAEKADGPWWRSAASGAWLEAAFADGSRLAPADLARSFGAEGVGPAALVAASAARARAAGVKVELGAR